MRGLARGSSVYGERWATTGEGRESEQRQIFQTNASGISRVEKSEGGRRLTRQECSDVLNQSKDHQIQRFRTRELQEEELEREGKESGSSDMDDASRGRLWNLYSRRIPPEPSSIPEGQMTGWIGNE